MIKDLLIAVIAFTLGVASHAFIFGPVTVVESYACDVTEHARVKVALDECSDAALACAWGEDYEEALYDGE